MIYEMSTIDDFINKLIIDIIYGISDRSNLVSLLESVCCHMIKMYFFGGNNISNMHYSLAHIQLWSRIAAHGNVW